MGLPVMTYVDLPEGIHFDRLLGPMFGLRYPSRKTSDLYILSGWEDSVFCAKCKAQFGYEELVAHLEEHAPRRDRRLFRLDPVGDIMAIGREQ